MIWISLMSIIIFLCVCVCVCVCGGGGGGVVSLKALAEPPGEKCF